MSLDVERLRAALAAEKTAIHCDTPEKAEALFEALGWERRGTYGFAAYKEETCVRCDDTVRRSFDFLYCSRKYYLSQNYTILSLNDFILPAKPRLAEILGVEVGQEFETESSAFRGNVYRITADGDFQWRRGPDCWNTLPQAASLTQIINNPDLLRIIPRWTDADIEDAKAVRRLMLDMVWVAREKNGRVWLYKTKPTRMGGCFVEGESVRSMDTTSFESVTWDNSPVKLEDIV